MTTATQGILVDIISKIYTFFILPSAKTKVEKLHAVDKFNIYFPLWRDAACENAYVYSDARVPEPPV